MISKNLAIAAAILFLSGTTAGQALAQAGGQPAGQTAAQPATPDTGNNAAPGATTPAAPDQNAGAAPAAAPNPAPPAAAPTAPPPAAGGTGATTPKENPYGLRQLWAGQNGHADWVARGVMILLALMSIGTWYIFFMKFWEQQRVLGQSRQVEKRFWSSNNLNEGIDQLAKNSVFRTVAESGVRASSGASGMLNLNDWVAMSLNRQLEEINARLQGGVAFLASVGSTAPFVGLFGTVWGILNALIAIGVAGQASIDKVAGPVGEALIMTAIGLAVAVPAVLLYNYLVRRNKVINEKLRSFASDLQTYLVTKGR
ncbi:MAG TPA: MotA/TolQ/ExbB proton channel family protein [Rhizomicrobium sp.]|jgi:biopolymer transport protein ExbB|nr:MotA/TolQ/ExbB proton channel family protein [Rhizomicrobium sp.]